MLSTYAFGLSYCRLALIYVVISLSLVISHAKAIEPQLLRPQRDVEHIKVNVRENLVELYENEEVDVSCRARGGDKIKETPIITFYVSVELLPAEAPCTSTNSKSWASSIRSLCTNFGLIAA